MQNQAKLVVEQGKSNQVPQKTRNRYDHSDALTKSMPNIPESGNSFMFVMKSTELPLPQVKSGPNSAISSTDCLSLKMLRSNKNRSMASMG